MATDKVSEEYGSLVFTDADMQQRLPKPTYKELRRVIDEGKDIDLDIANEVAHAMKEWALEKGATLVPAPDGHHLREARQLHQPQVRRHRSHGVLGQGAGAGGARCL